MKRTGILLLLTSLLAPLASTAQTYGVKKRTPRPSEFGNVVIQNHVEKAGSTPVVFSHWLHRAKYTCRVCHVDLGFAMVANETGITEDDNLNGLYCGSCHNGTIAFAADGTGEDGKPVKHCHRCHSIGKEDVLVHDFYEFVADFPRSRVGNRVDWMKAEDDGLIVLEDYIQGISIERRDLLVPETQKLSAKVQGMPNIIFSHEKHVVWNGCELCHPQIFGIRDRAQVYDMQEIFEGRYCGACHRDVAFPTTDCRLCHTEDVL